MVSLPTLNGKEAGVVICCIHPKGTEELDPFILEVTPLEVTSSASFTNTDKGAQVVMPWFRAGLGCFQVFCYIFPGESKLCSIFGAAGAARNLPQFSEKHQLMMPQ